ncbi:MAG TPA: hypothetical protein ENN85_02885 [Methanoculleus sp.]|nr:hypothetical protein [Methanoculleus sp.]
MEAPCRGAELVTAAVGLAAVACGAANILVWAGLYDGIEIGIMAIGGPDFFRWVWGSLVVVFGGVMMLAGARQMHAVPGYGKVLLGVAMIGIIGGTDIFALICENIPAGEGAQFFNSATGFIGAFAPPYPPAVVLLPFALVIGCALYAGRADDGC